MVNKQIFLRSSNDTTVKSLQKLLHLLQRMPMDRLAIIKTWILIMDSISGKGKLNDVVFYVPCNSNDHSNGSVILWCLVRPHGILLELGN